MGVQSCQEVLSLYVCMWLLTSLNLLAFVLAIMATAVLGSIKDLVSGRTVHTKEHGHFQEKSPSDHSKAQYPYMPNTNHS